MNGKDKLGGAETVPNDLQALKPMLQGMCSPERADEAFKGLMQWVVYFLLHVQLRESPNASSN